VMSDWGAVHGLDAFTAGLDQQSGEQLDKQIWFDKPLKAAVAAGTIPASRVDDAAGRVLHAMFAAGLFDKPDAKHAIDFAAHAKVAQNEEENAIVLLDNRKGLLPLAASAKRIVVIGGHADAGVPSGGGSSQVTNPHHTGPFPVTSMPLGGEGMMAMWNNVVFHPSPPLAAIRNHAKGATVTFDTGAYPEAAADVARDADVAIVFAYQPSSEGEDVPSMALPFGQDQLIEAVAAANPRTVVVLETGGAVLTPWSGNIAGLLEAWFPGTEGGEAIANVLTGKVNPSGRLPITFPAALAQLPHPEDPAKGDVRYTEGAAVGYKWYELKKAQPAFAFGYGLSYSDFAYSKLTVKAGPDVIVARFDVKNRSQIKGRAVAQVYVAGAGWEAPRRLAGFRKTEIAPGRSQSVSVTIDPRLLATFDDEGRCWRMSPGSYQFELGGSSADTQAATKLAISPNQVRSLKGLCGR